MDYVLRRLMSDSAGAFMHDLMCRNLKPGNSAPVQGGSPRRQDGVPAQTGQLREASQVPSWHAVHESHSRSRFVCACDAYEGLVANL